MSRFAHIVEAALAWSDPEYPARTIAVRRTLACDNRFTEEAIAFAINQQMGLVSADALGAWLGERPVDSPVAVGVIEAGNVPLAGFQDYLAVVGSGHEFVGSVSRRSPWLLTAFSDDVEERGGARAHFVDHADLVPIVDAIIASGSDETRASLEEICDAEEIPAANRLLRGTRFSVAFLDGRETEEERLGLAEDALLHEGAGCRNVALIFAPESLDADPYFEAMSVFRGTFPAHPKTSGALKMQQAFLAAVKAPHAYGEGLEYLISRGEAEVQGPGHIRWVPYKSVDEVFQWVTANLDRIQVIAARGWPTYDPTEGIQQVGLGDAQRPTLDWQPDGRDTVRFLRDVRRPE